MVLQLCAELSAADWLVTDDQPWRDLVGFGPRGFAAYARLRFIPDPTAEGQQEGDEPSGEDALPEAVQLHLTLSALARHTGTPGDCYFCVWDGWGLEFAAPRVAVPERSYFLFRGALSDFAAAREWPGQAATPMPEPAFVWPADHAWCVADDVDPHWAGIGASEAAIAELLSDSGLDVVRADPRREQPAYR